MNIKFIAAADNFNFLDNIIEALPCTEFNTSRYIRRDSHLSGQDVIWFEWMDGFPIYLMANCHKLPGTKWIARLHRYEIYSPRTIQLITENQNAISIKVDKFIFVSEYIRQKAIGLFPWMENSVVLPNLFDHKLFPYSSDREERAKLNLSILFVGRKSYVKNIALLLQFFRELCLHGDGYDYKLFLVGADGEPEVEDHIKWFAEKTGLQDVVINSGHHPYKDLWRLMWEMDFIICTSYIESQGMGIIEGMATGLKPLIYNFPGSDVHFLHNWIFDRRDGFIHKIVSGNGLPRLYSDYAIENFSIEKNIHRYVDFLKGL